MPEHSKKSSRVDEQTTSSTQIKDAALQVLQTEKMICGT